MDTFTAEADLGTDVALIQPKDAYAVFTAKKEDGIDPILAKVRKWVEGFQGDISTVSGRKEIASMAFKVSRAKSAIEEVGAEIAKKQKELPKLIDANRKHAKETLDKLRDEVRAPLDAWEAKEDARKNKHSAALVALAELGNVNLDTPSVEIKRRIDEATALVISEATCEEFVSEYTMTRDVALAALGPALERRVKHEAEQAELLKLREEAAERAKKDREDAIRKEAAEQARKDAELVAENDARLADQKAKADLAAAAQREADLKRAVEIAEQATRDAAAKAARDLEERHRQEIAETVIRESNRNHLAKINRAVLADLVKGGIAEDTAKAVIKLIASKAIAHVSINY